jgi:hypothetical protein
MRIAALHPYVWAVAALLSACAQQGSAPPALVDTPADMKPAAGRYAVMLNSVQWTLKAKANMMWLCPSPDITVDASAAYEDAINDGLRRALKDVTLVSTVLTPDELKAQGFAAEVVVTKGKARTSFSVSTGATDVVMSSTVTVRGPNGVIGQKTFSGQGRGKASVRMCTAVTDAIGASASDAVAAIARNSTVFVASTLNGAEQSQAKAAPPPKPKPKPVVVAKATDDAAAVAIDPTTSTVASAVPSLSSDATTLSVQGAFIRGANAAAGRVGPKDDVAAMKWFRIAADKGYAPAENNLGFLYAEGRGSARDDAEAVRWYKRAADRKYPPAETSLGMMYAQGRGVPQSDSEALALYSAAANQGYPQAKANLAEMYSEGRGVSRDDMTAGFLLASVKARPMQGSGIYVEPYVDPEKFPGQ